MKISVLDQSTVSKDQAEGEGIRQTIALARVCDELGYHRFWVSEHHNGTSIVGTAPEVLIAAIAATTERIRVGSAGVMLPHYSALKVAEQFRVLEAIAPGRIDLGVGRAPGSDRLTAFALNPDAAIAHERFPQQVLDLVAWLTGAAFPVDHPFRDIVAHPRGATSPEIWILGSSDYGARLAAQFGLPYAFAYFFSDGRGAKEALDLYRALYRPSPRYPRPHCAACLFALAAPTEQEARHLAQTREYWRIGIERGLRQPLVTPEEAAAEIYSSSERERLARMRADAFVGTADSVATRLLAEAEHLAVDEFAIVTWAHAFEARRRSYALLARAFGL